MRTQQLVSICHPVTLYLNSPRQPIHTTVYPLTSIRQKDKSLTYSSPANEEKVCIEPIDNSRGKVLGNDRYSTRNADLTPESLKLSEKHDRVLLINMLVHPALGYKHIPIKNQ